MSDRPKDWDPSSENPFLNSEEPTMADADKFIDELLAEKSAAQQAQGDLNWYDLDLGGDTGSFPTEKVQGASAQNGDGQTLDPFEDKAPFQEAAPPQNPLPDEEAAPRRAARAEKASRRQARPAAAPVSEEDDDRPVRRRRQKKYGCLGGLMYFVFVVGVSVILASVGWLWASDLLALGKEDLTATIDLPEEIFTEEQREVEDEDGNVIGTEPVLLADIDYVADALKDAGLIKYKFLFKIFCSFSHAAEKIDPGSYELNTDFDYRALVYNMQQGAGARVVVEVTIPEGYTVKETFRLLEENEVCSYDKLIEAGANYAFEYDFLEGLEYGSENRLEGYLFPDTYEFYQNEAPEDAIARLLDNFESKFSSAMKTEAEMLGYSVHEIITIASLIEKEAGNDAERPTIASVIYNRLNSSDFPYLNIDATVQYALPERKEQLTYEDLEIDSPYNTYLYPGLPAGPIANPGLASIEAALNPESTNYYFYALNLENSHNFFTNSSEFEAFVNSDQFGG